ncbi:MAG: S-layer homology domain-containing protein, partial [Oscillospiraceae bacterium]|nr:S-layer homology domain-containing protein [Oscillospiraceae bacterium]
FLLSGITLTPVDETKPAYTRLDLNGTHTIGKDKTAPSTWSTYGFDIVPEKTTTNIARKSSVALANGMTLPYQQIQIPGDPWQNREEEDRVNAMFTVRKNFAAAGYYAIEMLGYKWYAGSDFAIYVNGQYAGDYNVYEADAALSVGEKKQLNTLYIPAGDVEISFRTRVKHYATPNLLPIWMEFTPVESKPETEKVEVSEFGRISVGNTTELTAQVKMSDGSYRGFGLSDDASQDLKNTVSVTVENEDVATVSDVKYAQPENETDIVFAVNAKTVGETNIKITVNVDGNNSYTETIPLKIYPVPELATVKVSVDKETIPATRTATVAYELISNLEEEWTEETEVSFASNNENIATVDSETGVVTGVSKGIAEITVTAVSKGKQVTGSVDVEIEDAPVLESITVTADKSVLLPGDTAQISVEGIMSDSIAADMSRYTVSYKSSNIATATVDKTTGVVTTIAAGMTVITAEAENEDGTKISGKLTLNVYDTFPSIKVDFSESTYNGDRSAPTKTPGYTIVREESDTTMWRLGSCTNTGFKAAYIWVRGGMWPATSKITNNAVTLLVDIPYEHDFNLKVHGGVWNVGGKFSVFVDDVYAGDVNCYDPDATAMFDTGELSLNTLHLTAGEHKISFRAREKHYSAGAILVIGTIAFDPVAESGTVYEKIAYEIPEEIAIGETVQGTVYASMTDGSALHFGINNDGSADIANSAAVSILDTDVLGVSGFASYTMGKTGKLPFDITGKAEGQTEISLSVTVGGVTSTETVVVSVVDDPIASVTAKTVAEEVFLGDTAILEGEVKLRSGRIISKENAPITYTSSDETVATVSGDAIKTLSVGKTTITATATFNGETKNYSFDVEVLPEGMTDITATSGGSPRIRLTDDESDRYPLYVSATTNLGNEMDLSDAEVTATALTPEFATIAYEQYPNETGEWANYIRPVADGTARFEVTVKVGGRIRTKVIEIPVVTAKTEASYMTAEKQSIARENIGKYDWAKATADTYIKTADKYVDKLDEIYSLIASQEVPRSFSVGAEKDPYMYTCRYCGVNLQEKYGNYPWVHNSIIRPWKIQCPDCKRVFPSNDFESFYKLGLNEYGEFIYQDALDAHRELFGDKSVTEPGVQNSAQWKAYYGYGVPGGYLTNNLYKDVESSTTINCGQGLRPGETVETWGVDDGYGYVPSKEDGEAYLSGTVAERHLYIAEFMHYGVFHNKTPDSNGGVLTNAIVNCAYAYYFTGEKKYGRVAAILLDRVADLYRDYDIKAFGNDVWNSDGGSNQGKRLGCIWECTILTNEIPTYDMVYDMYEDSQVLNYIAKNNRSRYAKQTAAQIRQNVEDNFIRGALDEVYNRKIHGNFGMSQRIVAMAAVILDSYPETQEWIDYLMAPGWTTDVPVVGGGINEVLIEKICADGHSNEASDYGLLWLSGVSMVNNVLSGYDKYEGMKLSENPKYQQMFLALLPLRAANSYSPQIGDGGNTADLSHWANAGHMKAAYTQTKEPVFAQYLYMLNGNSVADLKYDMYTKNPESLADEVQAIIDEYGTVYLDSDIQTGFGYSILRDGYSYEDNITDATAQETTRNVWMYFGSNGVSHAHLDTLNIGMTAFGLNILPDLGYPEQTGNDPNRIQWVRNTISHNTVVVDGKKQTENSEIRGKVKHYDDAGQVQVIDVDTSYVYDETEQYRRSVVMINVDDANSYYVDLFRILGGQSHIYSFHAQSNEIAETVGIETVKQADDEGNYIGTYAGADVPYGQDPDTVSNSWDYPTKYPIGFTWLENVDRDENPENKFEIDFAIKDFNKAVKDSKDIHLRLTMLNGTNVADGADVNVAITDGYAPRIAANKNIDKLKYVLIENENNNEELDTVFTTVLEPYKGSRILKSADELTMSVIDGKEKKNDAARAVKVTLASGRVDYIFYATNNAVTYTVTDGETQLSFRGFVGVYSVENGKNTYKYVIDGDIIGEELETKPAIVGTVRNFTKELSAENTIEISTEEAVSDAELASLANRVVIIDNETGMRDGAYKILSAERSGENIVLNTGRVSMIRKYVDMYQPELGYVYTIAEGQDAVIPLSVSDDKSPEFDALPDNLTASAGSMMTLTINATSELEDVGITYSGTSLPRGATLNENTGIISWKPTASQVGNNHFAVTATDSDGRATTIHFVVRVYGSTTDNGNAGTTTEPTTPSTPDKPSTPGTESGETGSTDESGGSSGGGAGGSGGGTGGGGATTPTTPETPDVPETTIRFTDLGAHAWAADAINALADKGIIKGTSDTTYSPAKNITRADFAILLVRAFEKESDNTENFADVSESDYFAKELAIARNTGLVGGVGDNKFAPRDNIKRCDMMLMVYRVIKDTEAFVGADIIRPDNADFNSVPDYAKEAVSALIGAGLVNGKNNLIAPLDNTTRAEVAVLLQRVLDFVAEK